MSFSRRAFLQRAVAVAGAAPAFQALTGCAQTPVVARVADKSTALLPDPGGWLDLPEGFTYRVFGQTGEAMADGLVTPDRHDGMACFPVEGDADRCLLVRNHEIGAGRAENGPFGKGDALASKIDAAKVYDFTPDGRPLYGGTTTLLFNTRTQALESAHLSLIGTATNCAGGPTPWGSWLSCEETQETPGANARRDHGYVFEVPATRSGLADPVPLKDMGRYKHEAVAVDPATGVVYLTEDAGDSLFYRFLPNAPGELAKGGRLQALALMEMRAADTRNWGEAGQIPVGRTFETVWIDMDDVTAPDGDLRLRGARAGAAIFARGEGMAYALHEGKSEIFFACTSGGRAKLGQIWKYAPSPYEGQTREADAPGRLTLFVESDSPDQFDMCDNIVAAPWGDLIICEDGSDDEYVRGVRRDGSVYSIARNAHPGKSEFAGACFSPDGRTLFVNIQSPGATFAITGPWARLSA